MLIKNLMKVQGKLEAQLILLSACKMQPTAVLKVK